MTAGSVAVPTIIPLKAPHGSKYCIDSATRIEIRSETPDTLVFYTLNRRRPEPFQRSGKPHTHPFKESFALNLGKVTIRAVATSRDGSKQSSVVTKTFTVREAVETSGESDNELVDPMRSPSPSQLPSLSSQLKHRLSMGSRQSLVSSSIGPSASEVGGARPTSPIPLGLRPTSAPLPLALTASTRSLGQSTAVSMETTLSRPTTAERPKPICVHCKQPRSKDPRHAYCTHCGSRFAPLPKTSPKPPLQMAVCSGCRAHLPMNSTKCLVCEGSVLKPLPIPTITGQVDHIHKCKDRTVCLSCGTGNPPGQLNCVTCESLLDPDPPEAPPIKPHPPPPLPKPTILRPISGSSYMMCGVCGRVNVSDARFCDWCGSKPEGSQMAVMCASCSVPNDWHFRYCFSCGGLIKAPLRPEVELASSMKMPAGVELDKNEWIPVVEVEHKGPEFKTIGTQTHGIFYPSARTITNQKGKEFNKRMIHVTARDRLPQLHSYSPGKGLWRMQVDHLCSHLRAYAQGSVDFQNSIGSAQIGKMKKAAMKEHGDTELTLQLTFALKQITSIGMSSGTGDGGEFEEDGLSQTVSVTSLRSGASTASLQQAAGESIGGGEETSPSGSRASTPSRARRRRRKRRMAAKATSTMTKALLTGETGRLASELCSSGQGRKEVVESYIKKGADVNAVDGSGLTMLSLAASSGHMECMGALIEGGAKVNAQAKATGNTALHEAVMKGPSRVPCIETLLGHSANARLRNRDGLTPCELAMKLNHDAIVTCFATYVGVGLLDKLSKQHPSLTL